MENLIHINKTVCPYCGHSRDFGIGFTPVRYEGGSSGTRTFRCPNCGKEAGE